MADRARLRVAVLLGELGAGGQGLGPDLFDRSLLAIPAVLVVVGRGAVLSRLATAAHQFARGPPCRSATSSRRGSPRHDRTVLGVGSEQHGPVRQLPRNDRPGLAVGRGRAPCRPGLATSRHREGTRADPGIRLRGHGRGAGDRRWAGRLSGATRVRGCRGLDGHDPRLRCGPHGRHWPADRLAPGAVPRGPLVLAVPVELADPSAAVRVD